MKISSKLANYYIRKLNVKLGKQGGLLVNGENLKTDRAHKVFLDADAISSIESETQLKLLRLKDDPKEAKHFGKEVFSKCREALLGEHKVHHDSKVNKAVNKLSHNNDLVISDIHRVTDFRSGEVSFYDSANDECLVIDEEFWLEHCYPAIDKEAKTTYVAEHSYNGFLEYNPYNSDTVFKVDFNGRNAQALNTYIRPYWQELELGDELPTAWQEFMDHLFPDDESKSAVYHWLFWLLTNRSQNYLVLNSIQGTGKGIFAMAIKTMVGETNYFESSENFFKNQFNTDIMYKKAVFFDEVPITYKNIDTLKRQANEFNRIEKKGKDAEQFKNYASFLVANNHIYNCYFTREERRFSVPEITDVPLRKIWSEKKRDMFVRMVQNPEFMSPICRWVIKNGCLEGKDGHYYYTGNKFFSICLNSLGEAKRFVVDKLTTEGKTVSMFDLKCDFEDTTGNKKFITAKTIDGLLSEFYDFSGDSYGKVEKVDKEWVVIPSDKYNKEMEI